MAVPTRHALLWCGLWVIAVSVALVTRPPLPVDETRYLSVAWAMWVDGDYLVPHLNGEAYSEKPPLLFWLMTLGWSVFGVNEWWPRLVAPLFGLASLLLTARLARALWPTADRVHRVAPLVLLGNFSWGLFTTLTMFDMLLAFFTLLGLVGLVRAWHDGRWAGFLILGCAIGAGVLAKGPVILVHTLPVALLAPVWGPRLAQADGRREPASGWRRWYLRLLAAVGVGAAVGLAWAVPAALFGGEEYARAIFWGQSAGRMVGAADHARGWWIYGAALPLLLLPWVLWPRLWRARPAVKTALGEGGVLFCLCWFLADVVLFSAFSGKQLHYLLPALPAIALTVTYGLVSPASENRDEGSGRDLTPPIALATLFGLGAAALPLLKHWDGAPWWAEVVDGRWGWALIALALLVLARPPKTVFAGALTITGFSLAVITTLHLAARPVLQEAFDLRPLSRALGEWQHDGIALANFSKYHGQFHFLGRLERPIAEIGQQWPDEKVFYDANPEGRVISYLKAVPDVARPVLAQPYRGRWIVVWDVATVRAHPGIDRRKGE